MSNQTDQPTTASYLGAFRRELIEEGFSTPMAEEMVRDWSRDIAGRGEILVVEA